MSDRYPGYDVMAKRDTLSWNDKTRAVIDKRLAVAPEPRFFTAAEWAILDAVCQRIMPQPADPAPVCLAAYVDRKMWEDRRDGYRYAQLPAQGEAWRRGLAAVEAEAEAAWSAAFTALTPRRQDSLLRRMQKGELKGDAWGGMPSHLFFAHRVIPDITHAYYALPSAWSEIGFGGPASPRGYVRMALDRHDPWEAEATDPGREAAVRKRNARVG